MGEIPELIDKTRQLVALLRDNEAPHWVEHFEKALQALENSDARGCQVILGAYGGMGSFNDLILQGQQAEEVRKKLAVDVYVLADKLWKESNK